MGDANILFNQLSIESRNKLLNYIQQKNNQVNKEQNSKFLVY